MHQLTKIWHSCEMCIWCIFQYFYLMSTTPMMGSWCSYQDFCWKYFSCKMYIKVFHVSRTPPYGQWLIDTHKNIILGGGSSQIDGLEAGNFTFEDSNLIRWMSVVRKCVKTTFYHLIRRESSKVKLPASKPSIWLLPPLRMMFLSVSIGHCPYGGVLDIWSTLATPYHT